MPRIGFCKFKIFEVNFGEFLSSTDLGPPDKIIAEGFNSLINLFVILGIYNVATTASSRCIAKAGKTCW